MVDIDNLPPATRRLCRCRAFPRLATREAPGLVYRDGQYLFAWDDFGGSVLVLNHCTYCGGIAPSESPTEYAALRLEDTERERLAALLGTITSLNECVARLGPPDYATFVRPDRKLYDLVSRGAGGRALRYASIVLRGLGLRTRPERLQRCYFYESLSSKANVRVTDIDGCASVTLSLKHGRDRPRPERPDPT